MSCGLYDVWLSLCMPAGKSSHRELLQRFGSAYDVYRAESGDYEAAGIGEPLMTKLCSKDLERSFAIMDYCTRAGVAIICEGGAGYPARLSDIEDPPYLLYVRGRMPNIDQNVSIAVVGTRSMSEYGMRAAYKISYELSAAGCIIVSGMALGIDSVAACAALDAGGSTLAVLGCGVDLAYPSQHKRLMDAIIANGAVISEFPPGTRPDGRNFPLRNRIISALGLGTLVVEADLHSGALITARSALVQGRDIFAVPGNIGAANSGGTNLLIRDGANVVLSTRDIINTYEFPWGSAMDLTALTAAERISDYSGGLYERYGVCASEPRPKAEVQDPARATPPLRITYPRDRRQAGAASRSAVGGDSASDTSGTPSASPEAFASSAKGDIMKTAVTSKTAAGDELSAAAAALEGDAKTVYDAMVPGERTSIDKLLRLGVNMGALMSVLTRLEILGLVASVPGGFYQRK